jgi:hypothetical protein
MYKQLSVRSLRFARISWMVQRARKDKFVKRRACMTSFYRWIWEQVNQFGFSWVLFTLIYSPACWPLQEKNKRE